MIKNRKLRKRVISMRPNYHDVLNLNATKKVKLGDNKADV